MPPTRVDLALVRERVRRLPPDSIFRMLDDVLDRLTPKQLTGFVEANMSTRGLCTDAPRRPDSPKRVASDVDTFVTRTHARDFYEPFNVNYKNCTQRSNGTSAWIAECGRLLDRCVALAHRESGQRHVLRAFESMFELIDAVGTFEIDVLFFGDEGGIDEFDIQWRKVIPAWLGCFLRNGEQQGDLEDRARAILELEGRYCEPSLDRRAAALRAARPDLR